MIQETFPEIKAATEALESRIRLTESEIAQMKDDISTKKGLVRAWHKALSAFNAQAVPKRKRAAAD